MSLNDHLNLLQFEIQAWRRRENTHTHLTAPHIIILALSLAPLWVHSVCCSGQRGVGATLSIHSHSPPNTHPSSLQSVPVLHCLAEPTGDEIHPQIVSSLRVLEFCVFSSAEEVTSLGYLRRMFVVFFGHKERADWSQCEFMHLMCFINC